VARPMLEPLAAVLILLGIVCAHAQDRPNPFAPDVAVPKAWSLLTAALDAADLQEQLTAVLALTIAGTPRALDLFERVAQTGTAPVRNTALFYLPSNANRDYLALVAARLNDSDLAVRQRAVERLTRFRTDRALALLQDVIANGDDGTIESAVGSARNLGASGIGPLLRGMESMNDRAVVASVRTLDVLIDPMFSSAATENSRSLRAHHPEVVLANALQHSDSQVRILAALIAARLGSDAGADELIRTSESADLKLGTIFSGYHAMAALNSLGREGYRERLSAALHDPDERVRRTAASALSSFPHPSTVTLWSELWRGTSDLKYQAFDGLIRQGPFDVKLVRQGLRDSDPHIRLRAAEEILTRGPDTEALEVVESLTRVAMTRIRALDVLTRRGDPQRTATLARSLLPTVLEDDARMVGGGYDPGYRLAVVHTLEVVRDRDAVPVLGTLFGPDRNLNDRVVQALVAIDGDTARETLVRAMDSRDGSARILAAAGVIHLYAR
jgi:HEAT repeat protein